MDIYHTSAHKRKFSICDNLFFSEIQMNISICDYCFHFWLTFTKMVQFSSVQSLDWLGHWEEHNRQISRDPLPVFSAVSSSGNGTDVHSLMMSIQHFLCWPWCHPPSKVPWRMGLERLSRHVTCLNHERFQLSTKIAQVTFLAEVIKGENSLVLLSKIMYKSCEQHALETTD